MSESVISENLKQFKKRFPIIHSQKVAWGDMDAFQHVNNIVYLKYFETARMCYFIESGITDYMMANQKGPILGTSHCKYINSLTFPDDIVVGITVSEVHAKRFKIEFEIFSVKMDKLAAQGYGVIVYLDYKTQQSIEIPQEILDGIARLENRKV
ncbi:MAG: acyl-CoA thioesterase [Gammaproteobacteria bacterium]|nr:acyl-CoA thioesterase [Gammaproteobacteria bacterium]MDH5629653.1 acyl-CoA thioesterase [Gammaproteobacteria bacterium]